MYTIILLVSVLVWIISTHLARANARAWDAEQARLDAEAERLWERHWEARRIERESLFGHLPPYDPSAYSCHRRRPWGKGGA